MPQNPQNTISQTALKHYNQSRSVRTEDLRWLQITTDTGMKLKLKTAVKERDQQLLDFINILYLILNNNILQSGHNYYTHDSNHQ